MIASPKSRSNKSKAVYKPVNDTLTEQHIKHLGGVVNGGLLRAIIPSEVEMHLLGKGYVKKMLGGLMATDKGHRALMQRKK